MPLRHGPRSQAKRASLAGLASAAAKTPAQRSEAASVAAKASHGPLARFRRAIATWPLADDVTRREIRSALRDAGVTTRDADPVG